MVTEKDKARYYAYLLTAEWKEKRQMVFNARGRRCERCQTPSKLQIHHRHYNNIYNEKLEDLQILCEACHKQIHENKRKKVKTPKFQPKPQQSPKKKKKKPKSVKWWQVRTPNKFIVNNERLS